MLSRNRLLIVLIGVALGFAALLAAVMHFARPAQTDLPASSSTSALFAASFTDIQGKIQPVAQWQNQIIVVNFWATWCPPCRDEMPELSALQEKYRDRGLVVLGISTDDVAKTRQFAEEAPISYPLLASEADTMNLAATLGNDRDVLPYTLVLRRDGSIAASYFGRIDSQALESTLSSLL
jgi:peroxiredoxin